MSKIRLILVAGLAAFAMVFAGCGFEIQTEQHTSDQSKPAKQKKAGKKKDKASKQKQGKKQKAKSKGKDKKKSKSKAKSKKKQKAKQKQKKSGARSIGEDSATNVLEGLLPDIEGADELIEILEALEALEGQDSENGSAGSETESTHYKWGFQEGCIEGQKRQHDGDWAYVPDRYFGDYGEGYRNGYDYGFKNPWNEWYCYG